MSSEKIYSTGQFAKLIGKCIATVQSWDRSGVLPAKRTVTGRRYYVQADVDKALGK